MQIKKLAQRKSSESVVPVQTSSLTQLLLRALSLPWASLGVMLFCETVEVKSMEVS